MGWGQGCVQGSGWRGGLGSLLTPLVVTCAGVMHSTPLLLPTPCFCPRLFRSGSWAFWSLCICLSIICPNCTDTKLFLVPYILSSYFVTRGDIWAGASIAAKGPRSQVSACPNCALSVFHWEWRILGLVPRQHPKAQEMILPQDTTPLHKYQCSLFRSCADLSLDTHTLIIYLLGF